MANGPPACPACKPLLLALRPKQAAAPIDGPASLLVRVDGQADNYKHAAHEKLHSHV